MSIRDELVFKDRDHLQNTLEFINKVVLDSQARNRLKDMLIESRNLARQVLRAEENNV